MRKSVEEVSYIIWLWWLRLANFNNDIQEYSLCMRLKGTAGPINSLAFGHDGKFLASGGMQQLIIRWKRSNDILKFHRRRWKAAHLGCGEEASLSSHRRWAREMGANYLCSLVAWLFWKLPSRLFWNRQGTFFDLSTRKEGSKFQFRCEYRTHMYCHSGSLRSYLVQQFSHLMSLLRLSITIATSVDSSSPVIRAK